MRISAISSLVLLITLTSCRVGPEYEAPDFSLPNEYKATNPVVYSSHAEEIINIAWWEQFEAPALQKLIKEALASNLDLKVATSRIEEARLGYTASRGSRLPQLGAEAAGERQQRSGTPEQRGSLENTFDLELGLSWEIDLWGRLKSGDEAALANYFQTVEARRAILITLISDVAKAYFEIESNFKQLEVAQFTVEARTDGLEIADLRFQSGLTSELEMRQAETALLEAKLTVPSIENALSQSFNRLSILIGRPPKAFENKDKILKRPSLPETPLSIPSELLRQRPDLLQAEQEIVAKNAELGIAIANRFPKFSLTASYGTESDEVDSLFDENTDMWTLAGNIAGPIFTGGRLKAESDAAAERLEQSILAYEQNILTALSEVSNALENMRSTAERLELQYKLQETSAQYLELAQLRYDNGIVSYLDVLDAQRALFDTQLDAVTGAQQQLNATVDLYRALGGGWAVAEELLSQNESTAQP